MSANNLSISNWDRELHNELLLINHQLTRWADGLDLFTAEEVKEQIARIEEIEALQPDMFLIWKDGSPKYWVVFCDDEGWFRDYKAFTKMPHYPQPLIGKLLVLGETADGGSTDATISADDLQKMEGFSFPDPFEVYVRALRGEYE